ncbi:hypothetical protein [Nonomuraea sp. NPDC046570]|uniref:dTMP kinase n=1 Tax=Nonomuraea sp. NPDC046570 TaxID=3155255 RepID=UPI0033DEDC4A
MLIAFEGIDGAGKTTTAPLVAARLSDLGYTVTEATKRTFTAKSPFAQEQLQAVADRLWRVPHDDRLDSLGTLHWIYLNAAFFAGAHHALSEDLGPGEIAVFDNWINKFVARITGNGKFKLDDALQTLHLLPQPDMVFVLDVPPATAVTRKEFSHLERGTLHDGRLDFVGFQSVVRDSLLHMADHFDWTVVAPLDRSAAEVADEIAQLVHARLDSRFTEAGDHA